MAEKKQSVKNSVSSALNSALSASSSASQSAKEPNTPLNTASAEASSAPHRSSSGRAQSAPSATPQTCPRPPPRKREPSRRKGSPQRVNSARRARPTASYVQRASVSTRPETPESEKKASAEAQRMSTQFTARTEASPYTAQQSASSSAPAARKMLYAFQRALLPRKSSTAAQMAAVTAVMPRAGPPSPRAR